MNKNINDIWSEILKYQNETFWTKRGKSYSYIVEDNYLIVTCVKNGRIPKAYFEKAILIENPSPKKIELEGIWGPSYVYGIITDERIKNS